MPKVYLSPSDQTSNAYATGNTTEAIQCRRIAQACAGHLQRAGVEVKVNTTDGMTARVRESNQWGADLHVPIHTNAYNGKAGGTLLMYYARTSRGYEAAKDILAALGPVTPGTSDILRANPNLYELRSTRCPAAYVECEYHDGTYAQWIIDHVDDIGKAIAQGICNYFGIPLKEDPGKIYRVQVGAFRKRDNALKLLDQIRQDYPGAFIREEEYKW